MRTYKERYRKYQDDALLMKSKTYSTWTIASVFSEVFDKETTQQETLVRDFQSAGALLVNNLAAKLTSLLFPHNRPFFRVGISEELRSLAQGAGLTPAEISANLAKLEMDACSQIFKNASYNQLIIAMKHLIITGNAVLYRDTERHRTVTFGLDQFALRRDGRGNLLDCIIREKVSFSSLSKKFQEQLLASNQGKYSTIHEKPDDSIDMYTRVHRVPKGKREGFEVSQEVDTIRVGKAGWYPENSCPWQAPTWNLITGENYGRGLVEDFAGDFAKLSEVSAALTLYEIEATKIVNLVAAGSGTDVDELAQAETGQWVVGTPDTVSTHESGATQKIQAVLQDLEQIFGRLARAFMYTANTRDGERVTAYEIQRDALEAENTLGGVYSSLAEGLQVPMAPVLILEANPEALQGLITDAVQLEIEAGLPALGRSTDVQNIIAAAQELAVVAEALLQVDNRIDVFKLADLVYQGRSIDTSLLFKSDEQMAEEAAAQAEQEQAQAQMMAAGVMAEQQQALQNLQSE